MNEMRRQIVLVVTAIVLLAGCGSNIPLGSVKRPALTPTSRGFLPFSDWRVAYVGQNGRLKVVSLDAKTTLEGVQLPLSGPQDSGVWTAGASPDGSHLAYSAGGGGINYLDVHTDHIVAPSTTSVQINVDNGEFYWSPDGRSVVIEGDTRAPAIVALPTGAVIQASAKDVDTQGNVMVGQAYGWIDVTHLAVAYLPGELQDATPSAIGTPATAANLDSLDITTGALRSIVTIRSATLVAGQFSLTPDAREALFFNSDYRDFPFTPNVQRIDLATGRATALPHLTTMLPALGGFTQVLWIPGTHMALVATGFPQNGDLRYRIIDLDHDTATAPLAISAFPVAWSPDGRTLVTATGPDAANANGIGFANVGEVGSGPYQLSAVSFDASWNVVKTVTLTYGAMQIPMLGFVHNP